MNTYDYLAASDAEEGPAFWRAYVPDALEGYVDDFFDDADEEDGPSLADLVPELPDLPDIDIEFDPAELAAVPADVLKTAIVTVGDTLKLPKEAIEKTLDEIGDSRDGLLDLFQAMVEEAGETARDASENAIWAFFTANAALGAVVLGGLVLAGGATLAMAGGKLEVATLLAKAGINLGKGR